VKAMYTVSLTMDDLRAAKAAGAERRRQDRAANLRESNGAPPEGGAKRDEVGAIGEMAVCRALGLPWNGVGTMKGVDVGLDIEVKSTDRDRGCLIIKPDQRFVLVTVAGGECRLRGWVYGREGMQDRFWAEKVEGRPAWFVPQSALHPMSTLEVAA
jgi:hypothetical protein